MKRIIIYNLFFITLIVLVLPIMASALPSPSAPKYCPPIGGIIRVPCPLDNTEGPAGKYTFGDVVTAVLNIALLIVGSVAVAFLVYGGFRYITAYGNEEHSETAKRIIRQSIIGLLVVVLAFAIINVIANALIGGRAGVF